MIVAGGGPRRPDADLAEQAHHPPERLVERGPVLEVERAADALADRSPAARPTRRRRPPRSRPRRGAAPARAGTAACRRTGSGRSRRRACSVIHSHSLSSMILRGRSPSVRPSRESNMHRRTRPRSRQKLQRLPSLPWSAALAKSRSSAPGVLGLAAPAAAARLCSSACRREVPEVLVDPVRRQRALDALVPPRLGAHLLEPLDRRVPVVVHVVVVEDHRDADRREQPPDHVGSPTTPSRGACTPRSRRPPRPAAGSCRGGRG